MILTKTDFAFLTLLIAAIGISAEAQDRDALVNPKGRKGESSMVRNLVLGDGVALSVVLLFTGADVWYGVKRAMDRREPC